MALHRLAILRSSDDNFRHPILQRKLLQDAENDEDVISKETLGRRQDQRIKNDLTNKLYRVELDRIKPGYDVQLQTANFRTNVRPRSRHYSPEPAARPHFRAKSKDRRRYSTAGDLEIYRPKTSSFDRPEPGFTVSNVDAITPWRAYVHDSGRTDDLLSEYELRKQAELSVRGRGTNGPLLVSHVALAAPLTRPLRTRSSPPPDTYQHVVDRAASRPEPQSGQARGHRVKVNDSQYELDQFEKLMQRTFGRGGVNRAKTLLYTEPPYSHGHYEYTTLPPPSSYYYSSYAPLPTGAYYTPRPYYGGYYGGVYSPYYTGRPYYDSYYGGAYSPYSTLPARGSSYYEERPRYASTSSLPVLYSDLYSRPSSGLYSPPTRVTGPGYHTGYYDTDWYGETPYRYSTYTWTR